METTQTPKPPFQVVEMVHGYDAEWTGLQYFDTLEEAQAFAQVHYDTQIGQGDGDCKCPDCANGWYVMPEWCKSLHVTVWDADYNEVIESAYWVGDTVKD